MNIEKILEEIDKVKSNPQNICGNQRSLNPGQYHFVLTNSTSNPSGDMCEPHISFKIDNMKTAVLIISKSLNDDNLNRIETKLKSTNREHKTNLKKEIYLHFWRS